MRNAALTRRVEVPSPSTQPLINHSCPSLPNCTCCPNRDLAEPPLLSCRVQDLKPSDRLLSRVRSTTLARSYAQLVAVQRLWLLMGLDFDSLKSGLSGVSQMALCAFAFAILVQGSRVLACNSADSHCVWRGPRLQAALRCGVTLVLSGARGAQRWATVR